MIVYINLGDLGVPEAPCHVSRSFLEKVFIIYRHGGHLDNVTWTIHINFYSPFPWKLQI